MRLGIGALILCVFVLPSASLAQTATRPLDGRPNTISGVNAINRLPGTLLKFQRAGRTETMQSAIRILLPKIALTEDKSAVALAINQSLIVDPDGGSWYRYVETHSAHTLTIEGDDRLLVSARGCRTAEERYAYLGSAHRSGTASDHQDDGPNKEILFVDDCTPYRIIVECNTAPKSQSCKDAKAGLDDRYRRGLSAPATLSLPTRTLQRSLAVPPPSAQVIPSTRSNDNESKFQYIEPGLHWVRQYVAPANCGQTAKSTELYISRRTAYSRLVFALPDLMTRFPVVLPADKHAYANSQIFSPGGTFFVTPDGNGKAASQVSAACKDVSPPRTYVRTDGKWGAMDPSNYKDGRNFDMPWSDTFCEWRGNDFKIPLCGNKIEGPHFGADVRAFSQSADDDAYVVSVSDGVVVEVAKETTGSPPFEGFVIKVRSKHLIFVYRHLNPTESPFRSTLPHPLKLGDFVKAGQVVGIMGDYYGMQRGTTKHLHFEIEAPLPKAILLGSPCIARQRGTKVRSCLSREKAPPYPSLIAAYFRERFGRQIDLTKTDAETGLASLPVLPGHEVKSATEVVRSGPIATRR